jgi:UDP-3-O-[3-hydroxymyristoyl] glucosamine N-acyltransferase
MIGDFFSAMPGSIISGNVEIGDFVYMGNNSSIKEKIKICNNVIIGMNSAVVKHITQQGVYVGVPSKLLKHL